MPKHNSYSYLRSNNPQYLERCLQELPKSIGECVDLSNKERDSLKSILLTLQVSILTGILTFYGFGKLPGSFNSQDVTYICGILLTALFLYFIYHVFCYLHSVLRFKLLVKNRDLFTNDELSWDEVYKENLYIYFFSRGGKVEYNTVLVLIFSASALLTGLAIFYSLYLLNLCDYAYIILSIVMISVVSFFSTYFRKI